MATNTKHPRHGRASVTSFALLSGRQRRHDGGSSRLRPARCFIEPTAAAVKSAPCTTHVSRDPRPDATCGPARPRPWGRGPARPRPWGRGQAGLVATRLLGRSQISGGCRARPLAPRSLGLGSWAWRYGRRRRPEPAPGSWLGLASPIHLTNPTRPATITSSWTLNLAVPAQCQELKGTLSARTVP